MHDYHVHTKYCTHAIGEIRDYVEYAIQMKLDEIGFNDHYPYFYLPESLPNGYAMKLEELPKYFNEIHYHQNAYQDKIVIKLGMEIDYLPEKEKIIKDEIIKHDFDYVYGSVHLVDEWIIDDRRFINKFTEYDIGDLYIRYFKRLDKLISSKLFDVVSHIDVIKKFGYKPIDGYSELLLNCLDSIANNKMVLEINTSGIDHIHGETYPQHKFFKEAYDRDVQILLGSDAHAPNQVARYFPKVIQYLKDAGYSQLVRFEKRKKQVVDI